MTTGMELVAGQKDRNLEPNKNGCQFRQTRDVSISKAPFDPEVLSLDIT
jgi:hypothetical protein